MPQGPPPIIATSTELSSLLICTDHFLATHAGHEQIGKEIDPCRWKGVRVMSEYAECLTW